MIAERTFDVELIKSILFNDQIWNSIAEDYQDQASITIDPNKDCFMAIHAGETIIGCYILHPHNSATLEIHAHILPEYRKLYSIESGRTILKWFKNEAPENYQKLIAQIPVIYPNVRDFCTKLGFDMEGTIKNSYWKGGELISQWILGISRGEI